MSKKPFVTKEQVEEIVKTYPTPFHLYDEKGIRENAKALKEAFAWNPGYKEYFAVKATPNPFLLQILKEYGCGCDCSSYTELLMSDAVGIDGHDIGLGFGENSQNLAEPAGLVMDQELKGDDSAGHHVLERKHGVAVLIKSAAADIRHAGGLVHSGCLTGGKQAFGLRYL